MFATLDPTMRVIDLPLGRKVILSDTVGFISNLPTSLIAAFRATLEEVLEADIILHVRDVSHAETEAQAQDVNRVLNELGIDEQRRGQIIEVWNKLDLLDADGRAAREAQAARKESCLLLSAITGEGVSQLLQYIEDRLGADGTVYEIFVDPSDGQGQAWLHDRGEVMETKLFADGRIRLSVRLSPDKAGQAAARFGKMMRMAAKKHQAAAE